MIDTTLHSVEEKLERADEHLTDLEFRVEEWIREQPYSLVDEVDAETGDNVVRLQHLRLMPSTIPLIIGDCLYNLRSALDHWTHAFAINHRGGLTDAEATEIAFPIFKSHEGFVARGVGRIRHLAPSAQAVVDRLQPYNAGDAAESHWLWLLEKLCNIDKHRRFPLTLSVYAGTGISLPLGARIERLDVFGIKSTPEGEAELARYRCFSMKDNSRMKMNLNPTFEVTFIEPPAEGRNVITTLSGIRDYIRNGLPLLFDFDE